ncbi:3-galactosyl-N-acetylglucosaminide 4-alpha-L-fucosyltransferase FUT3-like [Styela clava]
MEPPWNSRYVFRKKLSPLKNVFNWTMTYRTDSDVYFPYYGEWNRVNKTTAELIAEKTERSLGVWVVSNCRPSRRGSIINELQKYISIDVFGKCNNNRLCSGGCAIETINRYKFYFSFENSRCKDYITEKFTMNGLAGGAVPVVMGPTREDYEKIAPVHSFIHVDDFPSIPKLAEYLQQLDKDDIRYGEYLKWKSVPDSPNIKTDESLFNRPSQFKALCEKIKQDPNGNNKEIVSDLSTWWFGDDYSLDDSKISVCHSEDGPSGEALHHKIATGYFFAIFILFILAMKYCKGNSKTKHKTKS